jgi:hypothetical protein
MENGRRRENLILGNRFAGVPDQVNDQIIGDRQS